MSFDAAIPVLRIFSVDLAKAFYLDDLGCTLDWEQGAQGDGNFCAQVRRDALVLRLSERHEDGTPGALLVLPVTDLAALHAELRARQRRRPVPELQPGATGRELVLTDPFGNRLRLCEGQALVAPHANAVAPTPLTRAQVRAEYLKARAEGTLPPTGEV